MGGDKNDGSFRREWLFPEHAGRLNPIHQWHSHVHQDQRETVAAGQSDRLAPGGGNKEAVAEGFQGGLEGESVRFVVVYDEDADSRDGNCQLRRRRDVGWSWTLFLRHVELFASP